MKTKHWLILPIFAFLLTACLPAAADQGLFSEKTVLPTSTAPAPLVKNAAAPSLQPTPTTALDPQSLDALKNRSYGNGEFTVDRLWYSYDSFDRYYVTYDSDDLIIHGFVNVPQGDGPFPVIIALHGYIQPEEYTTLDYTTRYADDLAKSGYIVLHPNLRGFPPSSIPATRRDSNTGYTIDVLNLLAYLRQMAGKDGIFKGADVTRLGIWGHSIGGSIALRTLSTEPDTFDAALLYGAVSQRYATVLNGNGIYDLSGVETKFSIHHGEKDAVIPVEQSRALCRQLEKLGKTPECYFYEDQPHTFYRDQWADPLLMERTLAFFDRYVRNGS